MIKYSRNILVSIQHRLLGEFKLVFGSKIMLSGCVADTTKWLMLALRAQHKVKLIQSLYKHMFKCRGPPHISEEWSYSELCSVF